MPGNLGSNLNSFPVNNLSRPLPSGQGMSLSNSRTPLNRLGKDRTKSALDQIDISKIGKGYQMTEGSYNSNLGFKRGTGLKGQLMSAKIAGRKTTTKNLSSQNVEQMHDLLGKAISRSAVSSSTYISRRDRVEIMKKSRELAKTPDSKFTFEDRKDLMKIVDNMRKQYRDSLTNSDEQN